MNGVQKTVARSVWAADVRTGGSLYYQEMRPILVTLRLLARFSYRIDGEGRMVCLPGLKWGLYLCVAYLVQSLLVVENVLQLTELLGNSREITQAISFSFGLMFLLYHFYTLPAVLLEWRFLARYFDKWRDFQVEYERCTGETMPTTYKRAIVVACVGLIPLLVAVTYGEFRILGLNHLYQMLPYVTIFYTCNLYLLYWAVTCLEIQNLASRIKTTALEVLRREERRAIGVESCRLTWVSLGSLLRDLGFAVSSSLGVLMAACGFAGVASLFVLVSSAVSDVKYSQDFVLVFSISFAIAYVICEISHVTAEKVGPRLYSDLAKVDTSNFDESTVRELSLFLHALSTYPPSMTLGGFVVVNRPMFVSLILNVITYLVVLIQFKSSESESIVELKNETLII